ncbi:1-deoxy-D-xylulose-5-phosphate synthase [Saccharospirillum sp. MSK14-1]|uniref:1-deoxy-D-xylulose-5-phosphate synthase n=1 Tax=Saccharospirillum sp. MSK14-1 TaxID=1897632 RepID=UPI000D3C5794|nr:1-deoxy-D-xylulose-5-phosphate synthase [Saccharospirillum sp. MSK14-1]PTY38994.1 1-deoxy-D-xylulose-5-phosphate synthase [Saccharospirillum sp. MSK14-1]
MKVFTRIPQQRPSTPLLDRIDLPADLRRLNTADLPTLADELREFLLYSVGQTGGHFGAGLGVVELTIALHYAYDTPDEKLVWDVGHQAYPHKILTGRRERMNTMRQAKGLAAFPKRGESDFDTFGVGHSSTSISAALGMAITDRLLGESRQSVAVIGDGALTAGMAFEALNHAGHDGANLLVILNDNDMSISENVGALSTAFARVFASKTYSHLRENSKKVLQNLPPVLEFARRAEEHVKGMVSPATLFEEMGFNYVGPVDGHDVVGLAQTLRNLRTFKGPQFLHVATQKGKGFTPAENEPIKYHAITKLEKSDPKTASSAPSGIKYSAVFGQWLCDMASVDERLVGITPAMREGSDLVQFSERFPKRYIDVAIAEQHAVALAAGLACDGAKPVVAIYSTFLQRAYDQLIHDVAIQNLDVLFAIDRAGLVGEDGPTHAGSFDLSFLRCIPNLVIMAPKDEAECRRMLTTGYRHEGPAAVRYPRGTGPGAALDDALDDLPIGQAEVLRDGSELAILAFGSLVTPAQQVAEELNATLINMRFIKPLDRDRVLAVANSHSKLVTVEENAIMGGAGSAVCECLHDAGIHADVLQLGLPDRFIDHAKPAEMLHEAGLDAEGIRAAIEQRWP